MFKVGNMVIHPNAGVCCIEDIRLEKFIEEQMYYVLKPIYDNSHSKIYVPVENPKIHLRKVLSKDDINQMIKNVSLQQQLWVENDSKRNEIFNKVLQSGQHTDIIQLIVEIHMKQLEKRAQNKKLHIADLKIMNLAEKMIHEEFAYALDLNVEDVAQYIMQELNIEI